MSTYDRPPAEDGDNESDTPDVTADPGEGPRAFGFETRAVHAGHRPDATTGASAVPIFQSSGFVFEDTEAAAAYFNLQEYGNIYSRIMNPTVAAFEERIASLEGGAGAVAFASGMAAQMAIFFTLMRPGDHIVASQAIYGGTITQLKHTLAKLSIDVTLVDPDDASAWRSALRPNTKALFAETIGNPGGNVLDVSAVTAIAHEHGIPLIVDNTFASPYLCRPIEWGADIVVHSATKYIDGHGTSIGGVVVDSGTFDWSNGRFPAVADPSPEYHGLAFHETFGVYGLLMKLRAETLRDLGAALSPFTAFLYALGLETLPVRMERHVQNAMGVARFLEGHSMVERVRYAGLESSPYHQLAQRYLPRGAGAVFAFDLRGGRTAGRRFIEALQLWSHLANVGDVKSLVIHPASTTHRQLSDEELAPTGVTPGTIRLSVGHETLDDLIWDLEHGLRAAALASGARRGATPVASAVADAAVSTEVTA
jgi:O-acetylhomoserine (thiol)-lyase